MRDLWVGFLAGAVILAGLEFGAFRLGERHGVSTAIASDYLRGVYTLGYQAGAKAVMDDMNKQ